jgi:hypothetical protein
MGHCVMILIFFREENIIFLNIHDVIFFQLFLLYFVFKVVCALLLELLHDRDLYVYLQL